MTDIIAVTAANLHGPWCSNGTEKITRKSRYRKDDRAMRPIYECPENCM